MLNLRCAVLQLAFSWQTFSIKDFGTQEGWVGTKEWTFLFKFCKCKFCELNFRDESFVSESLASESLASESLANTSLASLVSANWGSESFLITSFASLSLASTSSAFTRLASMYAYVSEFSKHNIWASQVESNLKLFWPIIFKSKF